MAPMSVPSGRVMAQVVGLRKSVRMMWRLSASDWWGGQPARGPTCGSEASSNRRGASASLHGRRSMDGDFIVNKERERSR